MENTDTPSFQIYYRNQGTQTTPSPRDHIIKEGEALCDYGVSVPEDDLLKPVSEVSETEWAVFLGKYSNLCDVCAERLGYYEVVPDGLPESPDFECPQCEEPAGSISFSYETATIYHRQDNSSFPPTSETHPIPRERYDMWRTDPEEPFSYSKLKAHIENNPHVFRPKKYQQAKIKAQIEARE